MATKKLTTTKSGKVTDSAAAADPRGGLTGSSSTTGASGTVTKKTTTSTTANQVDPNLDVKMAEAQLREASRVESYDPYADSQYETGLQQYRDAIAGAYERQRAESDQQYAKTKSSADRQAQSRGMGRSSYNNQIMANIDVEANKARQQISDMEEEAAQKYGIQLASELRQQNQWEQTQNYQRERDAMADYQADRAFNLQKYQTDLSREQWEKDFDYKQSRDAVQDEQWERQFDYTQSRDAVQDEQWKKQFDYNEKTTDQQLAFNYVSSIVANGKTPSDDLLKRAGLSRADAEAMKKSVSSGGGGKSKGNTPGSTTSGDNEGPDYWQMQKALENELYGVTVTNPDAQLKKKKTKDKSGTAV